KSIKRDIEEKLKDPVKKEPEKIVKVEQIIEEVNNNNKIKPDEISTIKKINKYNYDLSKNWKLKYEDNKLLAYNDKKEFNISENLAKYTDYNLEKIFINYITEEDSSPFILLNTEKIDYKLRAKICDNSIFINLDELNGNKNRYSFDLKENLNFFIDYISLNKYEPSNEDMNNIKIYEDWYLKKSSSIIVIENSKNKISINFKELYDKLTENCEYFMKKDFNKPNYKINYDGLFENFFTFNITNKNEQYKLQFVKDEETDCFVVILNVPKSNILDKYKHLFHKDFTSPGGISFMNSKGLPSFNNEDITRIRLIHPLYNEDLSKFKFGELGYEVNEKSNEIKVKKPEIIVPLEIEKHIIKPTEKEETLPIKLDDKISYEINNNWNLIYEKDKSKFYLRNDKIDQTFNLSEEFDKRSIFDEKDKIELVQLKQKTYSDYSPVKFNILSDKYSFDIGIKESTGKIKINISETTKNKSRRESERFEINLDTNTRNYEMRRLR
ncbi:hypothetical protein KY334_05820, partial [Candidatus Woesearchaeota archaeon]|nr:hypothetical protein [Candidatus Woesearchaeota archaeon]